MKDLLAMVNTTQSLEWSGAVLGLVGAFLLATNSSFSRYGWWAFLGANFVMIAFAFKINASGLLLQQVGFVATSIIGLYRVGFFKFSKGAD